MTLGHAGQYKPVSLPQALVPYTEPSGETPTKGFGKMFRAPKEAKSLSSELYLHKER